MVIKVWLTGLAWLLLSLLARPAAAQDFVYEPKNPSFGGGNTFNYQWLLSSASAQNTIEDANARNGGGGREEADPLTSFADNLNKQLLAQLTNRFITSQFGTGSGPVKPGSYTVGVYQIEVTPGSNGVSIKITDSGTGNQTTVTIPNVP
ncbi:curli production assembly/transport component CsgF [Hymenobacter oligotrophus]|uniref:Curli production assembly/transport component CsgF n=1 Tax=Hymenobacter oligotrophus TaxID=2319843 RepID=A0A3B7QSE9_9BACT|nr:curli production assembly/transport component CsgF [Hymenobacter oligotrophus]AYA35928.1 curli production assembly/transport component CsgF [Hymenobacter oligotrophus]